MQPSNKLDKIGIMCSGACAVHCMIAPILALASPAIAAGYFENESIHIALLLLIIPVALVSFYQSLKVHQKNYPIVLGGIGIVFVTLAVLYESVFSIEIEHLETILTVIGCAFLISAHVYNIRCLKCC